MNYEMHMLVIGELLLMMLILFSIYARRRIVQPVKQRAEVENPESLRRHPTERTLLPLWQRLFEKLLDKTDVTVSKRLGSMAEDAQLRSRL